MNREDVFNFSAGPSVLPTEVLQTAAAELLNYHGSGLSVMEMSHRSREFMDIFAATKAKLKKARSVPDTHEILFLQGGASLQFSMIPLNLTAEGDTADYAVTGNFANIAAKEAGKYCRVNIAASSEATGFDCIPAQEELSLSPEAKYFYYCANNTIFGTAWMCRRPAACRSCVICPRRSSRTRWTCRNSASSMPGRRRTWPPRG